MARAEILAQRIERAQRLIEQTEEQLARLENMPTLEDAEEGAVIWFRKSFVGRGNIKYTYVAVYVGGLWWLTGNYNNTKHTSSSLLDFLADGVEEIWQAVEWEAL